MSILRKVTESPIVNLVAGFILIATSGYEIWLSFGETQVGAHHGVAVYGMLQVVKTLPHMLHGMEELEEGVESLER